MLEREPLISILKGYYPLNAEKSGRRLTTVVFQEMEGTDTRIAEGDIFADCSYEGDLAAVTGVATRIGRESRDEYGEEYAWVAYTEEHFWPPPDTTAQHKFHLVGRMNLIRYDTMTGR